MSKEVNGMRLIFSIDVEPKDDGSYPEEAEVISYAQDILIDATKHDSELSWRVTHVRNRF
jgi:hypothetical protein